MAGSDAFSAVMEVRLMILPQLLAIMLRPTSVVQRKVPRTLVLYSWSHLSSGVFPEVFL